MDEYFFKAGKRENPRVQKLENDMDAYWAKKSAASATPAEATAAESVSEGNPEAEK